VGGWSEAQCLAALRTVLASCRLPAAQQVAYPPASARPFARVLSDLLPTAVPVIADPPQGHTVLRCACLLYIFLLFTLYELHVMLSEPSTT